MENSVIYTDELQHHGIKGQRWGVRRYQNKDGSLTKAGQKRYNKEMDTLKKDQAEIRANKKVLSNRKKTQAKIDKLEAKKKEVADQKKAIEDELKGKKPKSETADKKPTETVEERRARLLKSNDANELYKNRDVLTTEELNERMNRISTEQRLAAMAASTQKTGMDRVNDALKYYKKADEAFQVVTGSSIGKTVAKQLGLSNKDDKEFNLEDFVKNINKKSNQEVADTAKRIINMNTIKKAMESEKGNSSASSSGTSSGNKTDDNKSKSPSDKGGNDETSSNQSSSYDSSKLNRETAKESTKTKTETWTGTVEGEGTSKSKIKSEFDRKDDRYYDVEWSESTPVSRTPSGYISSGESAVKNLPALTTSMNNLPDEYRRR